MEFGYPKEAEIAKREKWLILIPVGTMEYHSAHCPYGCDALVSLGLAEKIAEKIDAVVFPPIVSSNPCSVRDLTATFI